MKKFLPLIALLSAAPALADRPQVKDLKICRTETAVRIAFLSYESDVRFVISGVSVEGPWIPTLGTETAPGRITLDTGRDPRALIGLNESTWIPMKIEIPVGRAAPALAPRTSYTLALRQRKAENYTFSEPLALGTIDLSEDIEKCAP